MTSGHDEQESPIEALTQKLYTPGDDALPKEHRSGLHQTMNDVPSDWGHEHASNPSSFSMAASKHHTTVKWVFGIAVVFFLISLGAAFFFLSDNRNVVSAGKIDISVTGPVSIGAGDMLPLAIEIKNRNAATLEVADLILEYPDGTRSADDVTEEITDYRVGLGDIKPGVTIATTTKAILFGEEGGTRDIHITLEYRIAGSGAIFVKESVFTVSIGTAPLSLTVDGPKNVNSGDDVDLTIEVRSNSEVPMENAVVKAEYPFGFTFTEADPEASYSDTLWALGDIEPEGKRTIHIKGTLEGQQDEERIFRFDLGVASKEDTTTIGTTFVRAEHDMKIERPFINLTLGLNGSEKESIIAAPGSIVRGELSWRNNLGVKMADGVLTIKLEGSSFDEGSVSALGGFYDSARNTITWDKQGIKDLSVINPGSRGGVSFSFTLKPSSALGGTVNPEVPVTALLVATPVGEGDTEQAIRSELQHRVSLSSNVGIASSITHSTGSFDNTGPLPPVVEEETTYTVTWALSSSVNEVSDGVVTAVLPQYVSWKNQVKPSTEDITYNPTSREVTWNVGTLTAGAGYGKPLRKASFQIGLTPSATQVGSAPVLVGQATFSAFDTFIKGDVGNTAPEVNTLLTELGAPINHDRVVAQ